MKNILSLFCLLINNISIANDFMHYCEESGDENIRITIEALQKVLLKDKEPIGRNMLCAELNLKMLSATRLDLRSQGIVDLRPLSGFFNLEELILNDNNITNLWLLSDLPHLQLLDLRYNRISDIGAVAFFTFLSVLRLDGNSIKNIMPIKDLFYLDLVTMDNNPVLTDVSEERAHEILGLMESLIWFRQAFFMQDYAGLNPRDPGEMITLLNSRAARGDLDFFRALRKHKAGECIFGNEALLSLLSMETKKIMVAVSISDELAQFFKDKLREIALAALSKGRGHGDDDKKVVSAMKDIYEHQLVMAIKVKMAIEYFAMENQPRIPFSIGDKKLLKNILLKHAQRLTTLIEQGIDVVVAFKMLFSPHVLTVALESGANRYAKSKVFSMKTGR